MKKIVLSALAVAAFAGAANAQVGSTMTLQLMTVARSGTAQTGLADIAGPVSVGPGQTVNLEIRYRIVDSNGATDSFLCNGLVAASIDVSTGLSSAFGTFATAASGGFGARLTTTQKNAPNESGPNGVFANDNSGSGNIGVVYGNHAPFRTGVFPNSNGTAPAGLGITNILPLATADVNNPSYDGNGDQTDIWYGLYSFEYTAPAVVGSAFQVPVTLSSLSGNGQFWLLNLDTGGVASTAFGTGRTFSSSPLTINVTPAPGAAALLGLGGLVAARRRRA